MKSTRAITLTLLSATMLTACCCVLPSGRSRHRDMTWYDVNHNPIEPQWRKDANGHDVPAVTPYDAYGRPWVQDDEGWHPQDPPGSTASHSTHHRTSFLPLFFGSGYRSSGSYGSSSRSSGSSYHSTGSSSVSRGGFGSTARSSVGS